MKERPILFSAPMVRALLNGTKTQTRRVVKPQPVELPDFNRGRLSYNVRGSVYRAWNPAVMDPRCPYGQRGDRLWVRETWTQACVHPRQGDEVFYRADGEVAPEFEPWIPSIHMFRWASRILLEIVSVRVERLQDISEADAMAEGLTALTKDGRTIKFGIPDMDGEPGTDDIGWPWSTWLLSARGAYRKLWESINGPGSWEANPWVWVIEFKRVTP